MTNWKHNIKVGDIFKTYHDTGNLADFVAALRERLSPLAKKYDDLNYMLQELDYNDDDEREAEGIIEELYDWADHERVWFDPSE